MKHPITVRYTGPDAAVLAGQYIINGETRTVPLARLIEAEADHPGAFEVVGGIWPATPIELESIEPEQAPVEPDTSTEEPEQPEEPASEPEQPEQPETASEDETAAPDQVVILDKSAPAPIINHQPQAHNGRRHEQQRGRGHGKR